MADNKKRVLIVDDDLGAYLEADLLFQHCGAEVEVGYAFRPQEALDILKKWVEAGHKPDIITCDDNTRMQGGAAGVATMSQLLTYLEEKGPEFMPGALFIHSKDIYQPYDLGKWGTADAFDTMELHDIYAHADSDGNDVRREVTRTSNFRAYCNQALGTNFPTTHASRELLVNSSALLDASSLVDAVERKEITSLQALRQYNPEARSFSVVGSLEGGGYDGIPFKEGVDGAVVGRLAFDMQDIESIQAAHPGSKVVLCIDAYDPAAMPLIAEADGILLLGPSNAHLRLVLENVGIPAALSLDEEDMRGKVLRRDGKTLISTLEIEDEEAHTWQRVDVTLAVGDMVSLGSCRISSSRNGEYIAGVFYPKELEITDETANNAWYADTFLSWADSVRRVKGGPVVKANADTAAQVSDAIERGAEGIGLCRTEHMFFEQDRLAALQAVLGGDTAALARLNAHQTVDFADIFRAAADKPVRIRLLDALPDEVLPSAQIGDFMRRVGAGNERGVQCALKIPGLYEAQISAIFAAAAEAQYEQPVEILVPTIRTEGELVAVKTMVEEAAHGQPFRFGSMIETKEAAADAHVIAAHCDFVNIGTNDLMSEIMGGIARKDYLGITSWLIENKIVGKKPFQQVTRPLEAAIGEIVKKVADIPGLEICGCGSQFAHDHESARLAVSKEFGSVSVPSAALAGVRANMGHYIAQRPSMLPPPP